MTLNASPDGAIDPRTVRSKNIDDHHSTYSNVQQNWSTDDRDRGPLHKPRYPHIKDLQAKANAAIRELSAFMPVCSGWYSFVRTGPRYCSVLLTLIALQIRTLLGRAQQSANQVNTNVTFKRQDLAYVEYLISSDILLNLIPQHKDFPSLNSDRGEWCRIYKILCKVG